MIKTCTAPCFPKCEAPATHILKTIGGKYLGSNCATHIPKKNADKDYLIAKLPEFAI